MSNDTIGYGKPPKASQFKKGVSGNPRGRPRREERYLLPRQMRKDVLMLLEERVRIKTPNGLKYISGMEYVLTTIMHKAAAGNPTAMKLWVEMTKSALNDRVESSGAVQLLDSMIDHDNRMLARLHDHHNPEFDLKKTTKDIF